jgi:hypothetical protein
MLLTVMLKIAVPELTPPVKYVAQTLTEPPDTVIVPLAVVPPPPETGTVPNVVIRHAVNIAVGAAVVGAAVVGAAVVGAAVVGAVVVGAAVVGAAVVGAAVVGAVVGEGVGKIKF